MPHLQNLSAISGRDIASLRRTLPQPQKFDKVTADHDFTLWLTGRREYLVLGAFPEAQWAIIASQYLAKNPLRLWQSHKAEQNAIGNSDIYSWSYFQQWCLDNFCLHDYKQRAFEKLTHLRQTASVADYKAVFDSLVAQTTLPMEARVFF